MSIQHIDQGRELKRRVYFEGSTALIKGQGVCYNHDYGTAATADGSRFNRVELPSTTNAIFFAGVAVKDYDAKTGGQWIDIWEPGSECELPVLIDTTVASTRVTCMQSSSSAVSGLFYTAGFDGRGSATILQTTTSGNLGSSIDGTAVVSSSTTLTKTGLFASASAGDKVVIFAGATQATGATAVTPGIYTIATRTSDDAVVLSSSPGNGAVHCVVIPSTGPTYVLAKLHDGPESGLTHWVTPINSAAAAPGHSQFGWQFIAGGTTIAGNSTGTLADGVQWGQRFGFTMLGAITTSAYVMTVTSGVKIDGTTATTTLTVETANDRWAAEWRGAHWRTTMISGTSST